MYFSSHSSDKQYFSSQKIDENVVFLATTQDKSGLTRQELQCVVTRNETLSGYRNCININFITAQFHFKQQLGRMTEVLRDQELIQSLHQLTAEIWNYPSFFNFVTIWIEMFGYHYRLVSCSTLILSISTDKCTKHCNVLLLVMT